MKEFGKITGRAVIAIAAGVATTAGASAADFTMKFAGAGGAEDPSSKYIADYTECVQAESQNRIEVQHFPGTQLGGIGAQIQGLQLGTIEAASMAGQHMKSVEPSYGVIDAPGLFTSYKHANDTYWDPAFMEPCLLAVALIVVPQSWQATEMLVRNDQRTAVEGLPLAIPNAALLVGFGLMALAGVYQLVAKVRQALSPQDDATASMPPASSSESEAKKEAGY